MQFSNTVPVVQGTRLPETKKETQIAICVPNKSTLGVVAGSFSCDGSYAITWLLPEPVCLKIVRPASSHLYFLYQGLLILATLHMSLGIFFLLGMDIPVP